MNNLEWYKKIDWSVASFLTITPLTVLIGLPIYIYYSHFPVSIAIFALIYAALTNLSVTAGYHRLFSHKSYEAHWLTKLWFLLIGASAYQGSALKWSSDHRRHHSYEDSEKDPYNINRGFFYAHMGWLFLKESVDQPIRAMDLEKDKLVMWQHRYFIPLSIFMGFFLPTVVGYFLGSAVGGFLVGGALKIFVTQQSTFFVNSLSHTLGKRTYSEDISARDSIIVAVLTHGEGYHNFHHKFQFDYRNGIRWYHWDPTKWTIKFLSWLGLARKLKKISHFEILKAKIATEALRLQKKGWSVEQVDHLKERVLYSMAQYRALKEDYDRRRKEMAQASRDRMEQIKWEMRLAKIEFQMTLKQWKVSLKSPGGFSAA
jgi:stearoyl-CoA desaturase (delta-9 desaturase)